MCTPPLVGTLFLLLTYGATCFWRPNNGALNWNTAAYLQALGAAVLALIGGPLIASIAYRVLSFELPGRAGGTRRPRHRAVGLRRRRLVPRATGEPWMRRGPLMAGHAACRACYDFADDAGGQRGKGYAYLRVRDLAG